MSNDNSYLLKVLTGAQSGAEVSISDAEYVLGSGPDDDIQFLDVSLKPGHARLRLENGAIMIAGGAGTVHTQSGISILAGDETWQEIDALDVITIGTTSLAIGALTADWSRVEETAQNPRISKSPTPPPIVTQPKWSFAQIATLSVLVVVAIVAAGWVSRTTVESPDQTVQVDDRSELEIITSAFSDFPFARDISVTQQVDGVIEATGYVDTPTERRALRNAIDEAAIPVRFRVWARAVIENETQAIVENQQIPVQFSVGRDGVLTLRGDVLDDRRVDRLVATITENVAGVVDVDVQVQTANSYLQQVRGLLERSELDQSVILRLEGTMIEANGIVVTDKVDNWVGFIQSFARRYAERIALRSFVQLVDANGQVIADPVSAQPGLPVIVGEASALGEDRLGSAGTVPNSVLNSSTRTVDGNVSLTPVMADPNGDIARQANEVGVFLDLTRLREGSFGVEDVFEGLNGSAADLSVQAQNSAVPASDNELATGQAVQTTDPVSGEATQPEFLTRASRPESVRGARVLRDMARATLMGEAAGTQEEDLISELGGLTDVNSTLKEMKRLWGLSSDQEAAYLNLIVNDNGADFTECWDNSVAALGNLPTTLFWLDFLSVSDNIDVSAIDKDAQVLLLEAALNPNRLTACASRLSANQIFDLGTQSLYLQETRLNPDFIQFVVRQLDPPPFALSGVNIGFQNRYAQLTNGVRLNESTAPDPGSLLVNVGELGLLVKQRNQLLVLVYDASLNWKSGG
ncbi:MAG: EscD/YscD/HrpQ family type III secretion system periplasmic domain-containing protein [Pseudomonadota bacterium]